MALPSHIPPSITEQFKAVIDSFGTFHPKTRDWNLPQKLVLTELGVEEARLLAWGDAIGINGSGRLRVSPDPPFVVEDHLDNIHIQLQILISLQTETHQQEVQKRIGLRPLPHTRFSEPTLDSTRLEAFLERQRRLHMNSEKGGHMKHYTIADDAKFKIEYVHKIRAIIAGLIDSTSDEKFVEAALLQDIKAMAWHPVFEENKALHDSQKLQIIRQACLELYPSYSAAASKALQHLNQEWQEHDEEVASKQRPVIQQAQRSSYKRKSVVAGPHGGLPLLFKHGSEDGKQAPKEGKATVGVFAKLFRRRSTHHHPVKKENGKLTENKTGEEDETTKEAPRSMSV